MASDQGDGSHNGAVMKVGRGATGVMDDIRDELLYFVKKLGTKMSRLQPRSSFDGVKIRFRSLASSIKLVS